MQRPVEFDQRGHVEQLPRDIGMPQDRHRRRIRRAPLLAVLRIGQRGGVGGGGHPHALRPARQPHLQHHREQALQPPALLAEQDRLGLLEAHLAGR